MERPPTEAATQVANVATQMEFLVRNVSLRDGRIGTSHAASVFCHVGRRLGWEWWPLPLVICTPASGNCCPLGICHPNAA